MCTKDTVSFGPNATPHPHPHPHFPVLLGRWLLTSHVFPPHHRTDFVQVVSVLFVLRSLPLMTTRGLSVSTHIGRMQQYLSGTLSLLTEKINFLLLCQSCENDLNLAGIPAGFQKEFVFHHFLSSDRVLLQRAINGGGVWGVRMCRQALHIASFDGSRGSWSPMILKPLESWLFCSAFNVFSIPKQEYCF